MLNWIRWNRTLVISFLVGALLVGGGVYTFKAIQNANSSAAYALTLEEILSCETPSCVQSAVNDVNSSDLMAILDELAKQVKPVNLQPETLANAGGLCGIAGEEIGRRAASDITATEAAPLLQGLILTVTEQDSVVAYPCQLGFVTGFGEKLGTSTTPAQVKQSVADLCPELTKDTDSDRVSYDIKDTLCSRAAGVMTVYASNATHSWKTSVEGCNAFSENNVAPCLNAAAAELRSVTSEPTIELADCVGSKRAGYCELIVASAKVSPQQESLAASENPLSEFEATCKGAASLEACRHGYILGVAPSVQFIDVCAKMGTLSTKCEDVVLTRTASAFLRISNMKGEDINRMCVTLPEKTKARCESVVDGILDYRYKDGLV